VKQNEVREVVTHKKVSPINLNHESGGEPWKRQGINLSMEGEIQKLEQQWLGMVTK
jgi:hypothetical protein